MVLLFLIVFPLEEITYFKATNVVVWMLLKLADDSTNYHDFLYKSYIDC